MLEALDYQLMEIAEGRRFELKPSEYFRRNFYACFWFEQNDIAHTLRQVGIDNALFETDSRIRRGSIRSTISKVA